MAEGLPFARSGNALKGRELKAAGCVKCSKIAKRWISLFQFMETRMLRILEQSNERAKKILLRAKDSGIPKPKSRQKRN